MWKKTREPGVYWFSLNSGLSSIFFALFPPVLIPRITEAIYHLIQGEVEIIIAFPVTFTEIGAPVQASALTDDLSVSITSYHLTASPA